MARYLVTGGCGFIGSHLVDRLIARGDEVVVLDDLSTGRRSNLSPAAQLVVGDIRDAATVREMMAGVDGCFHLAAVSSVDKGREAWVDTHSVNLTGSITVFEAAGTAGADRPLPVVYASSAAVYGNQGDDFGDRISETCPTVPLSAYGADKLGCELHARVAWLVHGTPSAGFRFFNVYGPRQDPSSPYSGVISIFAGRIAKGDAIRVNGDGGQVRDFVFVGDVVSRLIDAMAGIRMGAEVYNACTGRPTTINDLADTLENAFGRKVERVHGPDRVGDIRTSIGDPARGDAAFSPCPTTLSEGLALTRTWLTAGT